MKKLIYVILFIITISHAKERIGNLCVGLGYPYLSLKHTVLHKISIEGRFAWGKDIYTYSVRSYYNWRSLKRTILFSGLDAGYFVFDRKKFKGDGFFLMPFTGFEFFIKPWLSCITDIGIAYITTETNFLGKDIRHIGFEWVLNLGVYIYIPPLKLRK